jgi:hypothetical protein
MGEILPYQSTVTNVTKQTADSSVQAAIHERDYTTTVLVQEVAKN